MSVIKKYSYWIKSGQYAAIQKMATLLTGILSFTLLARILGPSGFGVWGLFLTITSIIETARIALVKNAFIRYSGQLKQGESSAGLQAGALLLSAMITFIWVLVLLLAASLISYLLKAPELAGMLYWFALTVVVSILFTHCEILMNSMMDFKSLCWMYVIRQGVLLGLIFVLFIAKIHISTTALSLLYLLSVVAGTIAGLFFCYKRIRLHWQDGMRWLPRILQYGKYVFGNNMSSLLFRSTDNFMTASYFGPAISAYYNASLRISNLVDMPSQVLGDVLFPKAARIRPEDIFAVKSNYEKTVGATLIFSIPALIILLIFPSTILTLLAGPGFADAAPVLRITAFFGLTLPFIKQFGTIMDATGFPQLNFKVMLFAFCLNILTNIAGIYAFGFIGAAIGTATTYFVILIVTQYILHKKFAITTTGVFNNTWMLIRELIFSAKLYLK